MKQEKIESAYLASTSQGFGTSKKRNKNNKGKQTTVSGTSKQNEQKKQDKEITCFFYKKAGHMKTCTKYATWHEKKGTLLNFVCSKINLSIVPTDTWGIDTGATTHISVTMQGCLRSRMPTDAKRYIYVGNDNKVAIKAIGLLDGI